MFTGLALTGLVAMGSSPSAAAQSAGDDVGSIVEAARVAFDVPGAAVVVVRDGGVVQIEGFGMSDRASGAPVDPKGTVFRIGSVSKPITALTAQMLAGRGELDLDADVAQLTGVDIPGDSPVTVQSLLTHTAGFEDRAIGIYTWDVDDVDPLSVYVPASAPARFAPTGVVHSFSNYG
jgi:CubicO group peptidase (beta-lactamase class C family)